MRRLSRRVVIVMAGLWGVLALAMALRAFAQTPPLGGGTVIPRGQLIAAPFALRDQHGDAVSLSALRGRVAVITFLDSRCREECPVLGRELALLQSSLGQRVPWTLLVVSVAPNHDTPASIARFARESGWHGDWRWLTGTAAQLRGVWHAYGIFVKPTPTDVLHTAAVYVVDPVGNVRVVGMAPISPAEMASSVRVLAGEAGAGWPAWLPHL